ncbi:hypothetical protein BGZ70_004411 [Mortierella alpina]|uniref:G-protein coupled receptors family 2 profile 2 domain-containing protein n=1 Tax=Mortierella alpina TaxID=64518 RepID=A0A9P6IRD4_MORAP|nr:hypothetical protein BGZ70_004411 [Mortierella alpina]
MKCPAVESFYEPGTMHRVLNAAYITRQFSLACAVFMTISYLVLPGKRSQPHISVLFLNISLSLWFAAFDIMPGSSNACITDFEESTGHNSKLCGAQGVLIIYLTHTSALWCTLLIYKLHLLAVWRSDIVDRYYAWLTGFCWIFPLAFAIPIAAKNLSQYAGIGSTCLVSNKNLNTYLFYPLAVYIYPAMLLHASTVAKMVHLAVLSSKIDTGLSQLSTSARMKRTTTMQAKRLLRGQWRPALMLGITMSSLTVFWLFYYIEARRIADVTFDTKWFQDWLTCVFSNGAKGLSSFDTQTLCAREYASHLPSIPWFATAEMLHAIIGIVVALVFVAKAEFWSEWSFLLSNIFSRGKLGRGSRGFRSPPSATSNNYNHNPRQYQHYDPNMRKGSRVGYNDTLPSTMPTNIVPDEVELMPAKNSDGTQWYDMDDLLDKEYEIQRASAVQRSVSFGSRTAIVSAELPRYPANGSHDLQTGDILYKAPSSSKEGNPPSTPSTSTLANPESAYLIANDDSHRYVDQPVIPLPVPRASAKLRNDLQQPPVFLSSPPQSPTFPAPTSLSPMPPRSRRSSSTASAPRRPRPDSVPIVASIKGPSASASPKSVSTSFEGTSAAAQAPLPDESGDQIMIASRRSISGATGKWLNKSRQQRLSISAARDSNPDWTSDLDAEPTTPLPPTPTPPIIPPKSPARLPNQPHPSYMSPPLHIPPSNFHSEHSEHENTTEP